MRVCQKLNLLFKRRNQNFSSAMELIADLCISTFYLHLACLLLRLYDILFTRDKDKISIFWTKVQWPGFLRLVLNWVWKGCWADRLVEGVYSCCCAELLDARCRCMKWTLGTSYSWVEHETCFMQLIVYQKVREILEEPELFQLARKCSSKHRMVFNVVKSTFLCL